MKSVIVDLHDSGECNPGNLICRQNHERSPHRAVLEFEEIVLHMTETPLDSFAKILRLVIIACAIGAFCFSAAAQNPTNSPVDAERGSSGRDSQPFASLEEELRAKQAINRAQKDYQENLDRARDLSSLGAVICTSFKQKNYLDQEDFRKLEKVEKLAKSIRNSAGGSEDEVEMEKPPGDLPSAMKQFSTLTRSLKENVEKTPKRVVSAAVIDEANVLLELIRVVRHLTPKL